MTTSNIIQALAYMESEARLRSRNERRSFADCYLDVLWEVKEEARKQVTIARKEDREGRRQHG